jgi:hypothetical protein
MGDQRRVVHHHVDAEEEEDAGDQVSHRISGLWQHAAGFPGLKYQYSDLRPVRNNLNI